MITYNTLPLHSRVLLLESRAVFISYFFTFETTTSLYFYKTYYIEMIVDNESNDLMDVTAFRDSFRLDKYLLDIVLDDLLMSD